MMTHFCDASTVWQVILLVLSVLTVITLTSACVISLRHKYNTRMKFGMDAGLLLLNASLYVLMQLDSRITGTAHFMHFLSTSKTGGFRSGENLPFFAPVATNAQLAKCIGNCSPAEFHLAFTPIFRYNIKWYVNCMCHIHDEAG